jgi:hypothetical protein
MRRGRLPCFSPVAAEAAVAPEAKGEVYKELGYRQAGMVGVNLGVACPMVKAPGAHRPGHRAGREDGEDVDGILRIGSA